MRRIEELLGMPVISTAEGRRLGTVAGVKLSLGEARVCYLRLLPEGRSASALVPWPHIDVIGPDAVLVRTAGILTRTIPASEVTHLADYIGGRPALTARGRKLGRIVSYAVDEATGRVERYYLSPPGLLGFGGRELQLAPAAVQIFGDDAFIVGDEAVVHPTSRRAPSAGETPRWRASRPRQKAPERARDYLM